MRLQFLPSAERTLNSIIDFYKEIDSDLGSDIASRVYFEVSDALSRLLVFPFMGGIFSPKRNIRILVLGFHIGVFYHVSGEFVTIIAVIDLRQDPKVYNSILADFKKS